MDKELIKNIIVRMPNWLGDAVMATPVLEDVRKAFPEAFITAMIQNRYASLLQYDPNVSEVFAFSKPSGFMRRKEERQIVEKIQKGHFDLGILLTNSFSSAWWFWRGSVKERLGFKTDMRNFLLTLAPNLPETREKQHLVEIYKSLLDSLEITKIASEPKLYLVSSEKEMARERLRKLGWQEGLRAIGINPGASFGPAKCWPLEKYQKLAKKLLEDESIFLIFVGDEQSRKNIQSILGPLQGKVCNLAGMTSLRELMAITSLCNLFVTNDSGPMHIAAALKVPLLALFGSTSDASTGPYKHGKIIHKHVECSPCYLRKCPIDFRCMKEISVAEVFDEIQRFLKEQTYVCMC